MTERLVVVIFIVLAGCKTSNPEETSTMKGNLIIEGKGFGSFEVDHTNANDVIEELGNTYEQINHKEYSTELYYKDLGLSFYYFQSDKKKIIFAIHFRSPFEGSTAKGIVLNQSTMQDVIRIYGKPDWGTCDGCDTWDAEFKGIEFCVEKDKSLPQFPLNEKVHIEKRIVKIKVSNE